MFVVVQMSVTCLSRGRPFVGILVFIEIIPPLHTLIPHTHTPIHPTPLTIYHQLRLERERRLQLQQEDKDRAASERRLMYKEDHRVMVLLTRRHSILATNTNPTVGANPTVAGVGSSSGNAGRGSSSGMGGDVLTKAAQAAVALVNQATHPHANTSGKVSASALVSSPVNNPVNDGVQVLVQEEERSRRLQQASALLQKRVAARARAEQQRKKDEAEAEVRGSLHPTYTHQSIKQSFPSPSSSSSFSSSALTSYLPPSCDACDGGMTDGQEDFAGTGGGPSPTSPCSRDEQVRG